MESLTGKVMIITGGSTGIGGFTARYLSKFKPRGVTLVARSADKLKEMQAACEAAGCGKGNVLTITADLSKQEDLTRIVSDTVAAFGRLDILVNNAAAYAFNDVQSTTPEVFDAMINVNIRAPFFLSKAAIPHLKKTKGVIINISSISAQTASDLTSAYSVSKAGLEHFTRVLAKELAPSDIRVNAITVGITRTDTNEALGGFPDQDKESVAAAMRKLQPLGGVCNMEDIAKVVTFLASDLSAAITGTCIPVDRGNLLIESDMEGFMKETNMPSMRNLGFVNPVPSQDILQNAKAAKGQGQSSKSTNE